MPTLPPFFRSPDSGSFGGTGSGATGFKQAPAAFWEKIQGRLEAPSVTDSPVLWAGMDPESLKHEVKALELPFTDGLQLFPFRQFLEFKQYVIRSTLPIPEEVHHKDLESFLILEGHCRCFLGELTVDLGPGGFLEIPLEVPHRLEITGNTPVLAILQKVRIYE